MSYFENNSTVIAVVDIDCFECQIYQREQPQFWNYPCVVSDRTGKISSVTYEAKACGINRTMKVLDAKRQCRVLHVFEKPNSFNKPDTKKLRHTSWEVFDVIKGFCSSGKNVILEYANYDQLFLDITEEVTRRMLDKNEPIVLPDNVYIETSHRSACTNLRERLEQLYPTSYIKYHDEERLVYGAAYVSELCEFVYAQTQFKSSAGVGSNKLLAKVACSINNPGSVTILPHTGLKRVSRRIDLEDVPGLNGRLGSEVKEEFQIENMSELANIPVEELERVFEEEIACKLFAWSHGFCDTRVIMKCMNDEVFVGKQFHTYLSIRNRTDLQTHLDHLSGEMLERLGEEKTRHRRITNYLKVQFTFHQRGRVFTRSKSFPISSSDTPSSVSQKSYQQILDCGISEIMKITRLNLIAKSFSPI